MGQTHTDGPMNSKEPMIGLTDIGTQSIEAFHDKRTIRLMSLFAFVIILRGENKTTEPHEPNLVSSTVDVV